MVGHTTCREFGNKGWSLSWHPQVCLRGVCPALLGVAPTKQPKPPLFTIGRFHLTASFLFVFRPHLAVFRAYSWFCPQGLLLAWLGGAYVVLGDQTLADSLQSNYPPSCALSLSPAQLRFSGPHIIKQKSQETIFSARPGLHLHP